MTYKFKLWEELAWGIGIAIVTVLLTSFTGDPPTNWSEWITLTLWSSSRAALGAVINVARMARGERGQTHFAHGVSIAAFVIVVLFVLWLAESAGKTNFFP